MKIKITFIFLIFFSVLLFAEYRLYTYGDFNYTVEDKDVTILHYDGIDTSVIIPGNINGYTIVDISSDAFDNSHISSIILPETITVINRGAFSNCKNLKRVGLPSSLKIIQPQAFSRCTSLSDISLPENIVVIGDQAFVRCESLTNFFIPNSVKEIGPGAFYGCSNLLSFQIPNEHPTFSVLNSVLFNKATKTLHTYLNSKQQSKYVVPEGISTIGEYAFNASEYISEVVLPKSVTKIEDSAFAGCINLSSIEIPSSVTSIGDYVFDGCKKLLLKVHENTYLHNYAIENEIPFELVTDTSWLN